MISKEEMNLMMFPIEQNWMRCIEVQLIFAYSALSSIKPLFIEEGWEI